MELRTLGLIILIYLIVSIAYVIVRSVLFPHLGNCITMFDWPFMAIAPPMAMYAISVIDRQEKENMTSKSEGFCSSPSPYCDQPSRGCTLTFGETGYGRGPKPIRYPRPAGECSPNGIGLPLGQISPTVTDTDIYNFGHKNLVGTADSFNAQLPFECPGACTPDYRYIDENERDWRRRTSGVRGGPSPASFSPEELGRNFRETNRFYYGKGMVEVDDFYAREQLKRAKSRRDSKMGAYYQQARLHDLYHRDESYRNMDGLPNGSPYDPEWWDNDIRL